MIDYHQEYSKLSELYNQSLLEYNELLDHNRDLQVLVFDMLAYQTKMSLLHDDAGIGEANTMFLNRLREILGYKRLDGIEQTRAIAGDM